MFNYEAILDAFYAFEAKHNTTPGLIVLADEEFTDMWNLLSGTYNNTQVGQEGNLLFKGVPVIRASRCLVHP